MLKAGRLVAVMVAVASVAALVACEPEGKDEPAAISRLLPQPSRDQLVAAGLGDLPVAPDAQRVDLNEPTFSNPTDITNPLFPVSNLHSVVFSGRVDGKAFHTETTLLPETTTVEWSENRSVETRVSQYIAYLGGRITEAAIDLYAQADDGSVWYFGESVFDYRNGTIFSTEGTWLAGRDGPPAMIMPADPRIGDVHRAENIPGLAFEEVAVKTVDKTVEGPTGPVEGAMIAKELHDDAAVSDKVFAPGYGEFFTRDRGEIEAMALAVPADAVEGPVPPGLAAIWTSSDGIYAAVRAERWRVAGAKFGALSRAWKSYASSDLPPRLAGEMERAFDALGSGIEDRDVMHASTAAIDVAQSALDLELRYRPPAEVDLGRFLLWTKQLAVDASVRNFGGVTGDVATLEWIRDRFAATLDPIDLTRIDAHLLVLSESVADRDMGLAGDEAGRLVESIRDLSGSG
ncbi:MAG: hypothetical protein QOG16_1334 [Actinomycetota bacterium]|jgi:hypothetical protein|nr:hypothetical protein [Actinomycetota bacterium]